MVLVRKPTDYAFGTLSVAAAVGDTSLTSAAFANLSNIYTTSLVLPVVLHNPATGVREVVWVTAHSTSSTAITVIRGKEGTTAQAWPSGTQWICAPTATRDGLPALAAATLTGLTDQHVGMRALETDTNIVKQWTIGGGWQMEVGACLPTDVGSTFSGGSVPTQANILQRMGCVLGVSPSSGLYAVTFPNAFPNGVIGALAVSLNGTQFVGAICCESITTSGMNLRPVQYSSTSPSVFSAFWLAFGW